MSKKHLSKLSSELSTYYLKEVEAVDTKVVEMSSVSMVDPDEWNEVTEKLRSLSLAMSNLSNILTMAGDTAMFTQALFSRRNLIKSLNEVLERIEAEQPESELIGTYRGMIEGNLPTLELLEEVNRFRCYPRSKKRYKKWVKKGWIDQNFKPFDKLRKDLEKISELID